MPSSISLDAEETAPQRLTARIPAHLAGRRLDQALAELFAGYSRARLQQWVRGGQVRVNRAQWRPRDKVRGGETVEILASMAQETPWQPEALALDIVYEDTALLVINKPPGLVVHPGAGNRAGTLLNALLHYAPELAGVPRAGIVHRLDKDTSGLLVVARDLSAQKNLVEQLQAHTVRREYDAVVVGVMTAGGRVDRAVGRHPSQRTRMAVARPESKRGKPAVTHYRVLERFRAHTYVRARLETGRTHQIRVHMAHIHHPLVGDPLYGGRLRIPKGASEQLIDTLRNFKRQALHAGSLGLIHPRSGAAMQWSAPLPADMARLLEALRADVQASS
ncbi:MAG: 23S rRNA pseudouridine(1911/1915/1917) synthase RluD [Pseudomonadota bacterium]